jgi:hypothetical protein
MTQNTPIEQGKTIHPALDFVAEHAYVGVKRNTRVGPTSCLIRDDGQQIPCSQHEMDRLNICLVPLRCINYPKWSDQSITAFTNGTAPIIETNQLFQQVKQLFTIHVEHPNPKLYDLLALWNIGTYYFPLFISYPYVFMNGQTESGKSKTLNLCTCISFNGQFSLNMNPPNIFRLINESRCTLILDELEHQLTGRMRNQQFTTMLNGGYTKLGVVQRLTYNEDTGEYESRNYATYSPKMLANIVGMDYVLESRCITIHTQRSYNPTITRTAVDIDDPVFQQIRDAQFVYMMRNWKTIKQVYDETLEAEGITGRNWELWRPILALAKHFGGDNLVVQMKALAAECIVEGTLDNSDSNENLLIETLLSVVKEDGFYKLSQIREEFVSHMEDSNWKPNARYVGKLLRTLGFKEKRRRNYGFEYLLKVEKIKQLAKDHGISVDSVPSEAPIEILTTEETKKEQPNHRSRELPRESQRMSARDTTLGEHNV